MLLKKFNHSIIIVQDETWGKALEQFNIQYATIQKFSMFKYFIFSYS